MTTGTHDQADGPRLVELVVPGAPGPWAAAGFVVGDGSAIQLGAVRVRCDGSDPAGPGRAGGIVGWALSGVALAGDDLDGLPTTVVPPADPPPPPVHPNGVVGLDHVVVATPDLDRTLAALGAAGLDLRRIRDTTAGGAPLRQAFFRLGPTILEVVSGGALDGGDGDGPSSFWGLALDVDDLDATATVLGAGLGRIKQAVQRGRRIATLRHRDLGLPVGIAALDHRGTGPDDGR